MSIMPYEYRLPVTVLRKYSAGYLPELKPPTAMCIFGDEILD